MPAEGLLEKCHFAIVGLVFASICGCAVSSSSSTKGEQKLAFVPAIVAALPYAIAVGAGAASGWLYVEANNREAARAAGADLVPVLPGDAESALGLEDDASFDEGDDAFWDEAPLEEPFVDDPFVDPFADDPWLVDACAYPLLPVPVQSRHAYARALGYDLSDKTAFPTTGKSCDPFAVVAYPDDVVCEVGTFGRCEAGVCDGVLAALAPPEILGRGTMCLPDAPNLGPATTECVYRPDDLGIGGVLTGQLAPFEVTEANPALEPSEIARLPEAIATTVDYGVRLLQDEVAIASACCEQVGACRGTPSCQGALMDASAEMRGGDTSLVDIVSEDATLLALLECISGFQVAQ